MKKHGGWPSAQFKGELSSPMTVVLLVVQMDRQPCEQSLPPAHVNDCCACSSPRYRSRGLALHRESGMEFVALYTYLKAGCETKTHSGLVKSKGVVSQKWNFRCPKELVCPVDCLTLSVLPFLDLKREALGSVL